MLTKSSKCQGCPLQTQGLGFAPASGWTGRKIWLIGEALSETEAIEGKPFVGGTGRILNALLASAGIYRDECYLTNIVKCQPPKGRIPTYQEIEFCMSAYLNDELAQATNETVIVIFGDTPLLALTGLDKVQKRRGSWYHNSKTKGHLLSTIHPKDVIKQPELWSIVVSDLKHKAKRGYQSPQDCNYILRPGIDQVEKSIDFIINSGQDFSLDIETSFDSVYQSALLCVGLCYEGEAICIPWSGNYWKEHEPRVIENLFNLLKMRQPIVQNGLFDLLYFYLIGFPLTNPAFDTMLAHHLMFAELPHDLGFLTSIYTDMPYYKDEGKGDSKLGQVPKEQLWTYNCKDIDSTLQCSKELKKELKEFGLETFFYQKVLPMVPVLIKIMTTGIHFDQAKATELIKPLEEQMSQLLAGMKEFVGDQDFNPLSPKQLGKVLYEKFKLPIIKRTPTGAPSTDEDTLTKLLAKYSTNPILEGISVYRQMNTKISTFLTPNFEVDGKVHTSFLLHGTTTGRLSSRNPNLQNVPEDLRIVYIPSEGKLFYQFDFSQIELRIMSYLSGEIEWISAIEDITRDIHAENAEIIFGPLLERVGLDIKVSCQKGVKICWRGKDRELRKFTKNYTYCLMYGGGVEAVLVTDPGILTLEEAKAAEFRLMSARANVKAFREKIKAEVMSTHKITNVFGRPRIFLGSKGNMLTSAYDYPMQSAAAQIINDSMVRIDKIGVPGMLLQVHDSLLFEWTDEEANLFTQVVKLEMERPIQLGERLVSFPVDMTKGINWGEQE